MESGSVRRSVTSGWITSYTGRNQYRSKIGSVLSLINIHKQTHTHALCACATTHTHSIYSRTYRHVVYVCSQRLRHTHETRTQLLQQLFTFAHSDFIRAKFPPGRIQQGFPFPSVLSRSQLVDFSLITSTSQTFYVSAYITTCNQLVSYSILW